MSRVVRHVVAAAERLGNSQAPNGQSPDHSIRYAECIVPSPEFVVSQGDAEATEASPGYGTVVVPPLSWGAPYSVLPFRVHDLHPALFGSPLLGQYGAAVCGVDYVNSQYAQHAYAEARQELKTVRESETGKEDSGNHVVPHAVAYTLIGRGKHSPSEHHLVLPRAGKLPPETQAYGNLALTLANAEKLAESEGDSGIDRAEALYAHVDTIAEDLGIQMASRLSRVRFSGPVSHIRASPHGWIKPAIGLEAVAITGYSYNELAGGAVLPKLGFALLAAADSGLLFASMRGFSNREPQPVYRDIIVTAIEPA